MAAANLEAPPQPPKPRLLTTAAAVCAALLVMAPQGKALEEYVKSHGGTCAFTVVSLLCAACCLEAF